MSDSAFTTAPTVSVVMAVYNSEMYLSASIGSILAQTFADWEMICVNDGSSDGSLEVLRRYEHADGRVRVITRPNTGLTRARNDGIAVARGRYIAVMDSDDVALPERLHRQVHYMESHPECVGLGAAVRVVGPDLKPIYDEPKASDHETIDCQTLAGSGAAIHEPVAMFRAEAVRQLGGYRDEIFAYQDADMYLRLAEIGRLANLPDTLLLYRLRLGSINRTQGALQAQYQLNVLRDARIRRGLQIDAQIADSQQVSVEVDDGRGSWALWSHYAFNGRYQGTARCYAWRAVRSEPLAPTSWKAVLRAYLRSPPSKL